MASATAVSAAGPYKGLTHFTEGDAAFFFGRESERDLLVASLKASRLTLVYGQSGAGKSSLLRAGVAASLRAAARRDMDRFGSAEFVPVVFSTWRDDPLEGLAAAISESAAEFAVSAVPAPPLPTTGTPQGLVPLIEAWAAKTQASLLLIFDQFEEYLLYHRADSGQQTFAEQFPAAVNQPGLPAGFLVAIREDGLAQLDRFKNRIPNLFGSYRRVTPLSKRAAREAIRLPIDEYNRGLPPEEQVSIEPELVTAVVDQVATGEVTLETVGAGSLGNGATDAVEAPYLQLVMTRIWAEEMAEGSGRLRLSTLEGLGGAQKIVRSHLDATLGALPTDDQDVAADVFHHLVTPSGTKIAHAVRDLVDYTQRAADRVAAVLDRLGEGDTRIVRAVQPPVGTQGPPRYEIFHDVLAPAVLDWRGRYAARRLQLEKEQAEQRARVQRRRAITGWAATALALALLGTFVVINALDERDSNRSRVLAAESVESLAGDPELSTLLALSALRTSPTPQAQAALRQSFPQIEEEKTLEVGGSVSGVAFSPDGRLLAAASSESGYIKIWGPGLSGHPRARRTDFSVVDGLAFSPDGRHIAVVGQVRASWHSHHWPGVEVLATAGTGPAEPVYVPATSLDSQPAGYGVAWQGPVGGDGYLVTADSNGYLCLYYANGMAAARCAPTPFNGLASVTLDQAGTEADISGGSGATVWSVPGLKEVFPTDGSVWGVGNVQSSALSPDGRALATASTQGVTQVTGLYGNHPILAQFSSGGAVITAAFNRNGKQLATATDLGQTTVWQLAPSSQIGGVVVAQLNCDCGLVNSAEFDPVDQTELVTGSEDGMVRVWDTRPRDEVFTSEVSPSLPWSGQTDGIGSLAFVNDLGDAVALSSGPVVVGGPNPDQATVVDLRTGRRAVVRDGRSSANIVSLSVSQVAGRGRAAVLVGVVQEANGQDEVRGWDLRDNAPGSPALTGARLALPRTWAGSPQNLAISPNGAWLAVSFSDNNDIEVVDLTSGKTAELPRASSHPYFVNSIAFDATGDRLLVCYNDGGAWEWSLAHRAARDGATFEGAFPDPSPVAVGLDAQFSANGQAVLLADNLGNIAVYATKTRRLAEELNAGDGLINTAMFSPDGSTILTAGDDGTMRLWNLASRTQLAIFGPSDEPFVTAVNTAVFGTFSAGPAVISGGNDGYIRVWSAEAATPTLSQLERAARDRVTRSYTPAERTEFLSS